MMGKVLLGIAVVAVSLWPTLGQAVSFTCEPDAPLTCSGSVTLVDADTVTISITNTSASGFITAIAFDLTGAVTPTNLVSSDPDFSLFVGPIDTQPPGGETHEFSIALDDDWQGGGTPTLGIGAGSTATFTFDLVGGSVTESSVKNSLDIRARGFADGGSDKDGTNGNGVVSEPGTLTLLGLGLVAVGILGRRSFRKRR
jgi:hypothetical protein